MDAIPSPAQGSNSLSGDDAVAGQPDPDHTSPADTDTEQHRAFARYVGIIRFPQTPQDLTDRSRCPACLTPLRTMICGSCSLDLTNPAAFELAELSDRAAALLERRVDIVGHMRFDSIQAASNSAAAAATAAAASAAPAAASAAVTRPAPVAIPMTAGPVGTHSDASVRHQEASPPAGERLPPPPAFPVTSPSAPSGRTGRSGVQILLLIVGISLLSIAALFFLAFAFIILDELGRSIVVGAITVGVMFIASRLQRRGLEATAEAIAVLAVVLVYLDIWGLWANDVFRTHSSSGQFTRVDPSAFWGWSLLVAAIVFVAWHRYSTLRSPSVAAAFTFAPAIGLIVVGALDGVDSGARVCLGFAAAALAGVACRLFQPLTTPDASRAKRTPERIALLSTSLLGLLGAAISALSIYPENGWTSTFALLGVGAIAVILLTALVVRVSSDRVTVRRADRTSVFFCTLLAILGGASFAGAVSVGALRAGQPLLQVSVSVVAAAITALSLEGLFRRQRSAAHPFAFVPRSAAVAAALVTVITAILPTVMIVITTVAAAFSGILDVWSRTPSDSLVTLPDFDWAYPSENGVILVGSALFAIAAIGAITATVWFDAGILRSRSLWLAWLAAPIPLAAVALLPTVLSTMVGWLVVSCAALITLIQIAAHRSLRRYRPPLLALCTATGVSGYFAGWASDQTWQISTIVCIAILLVSRRLFARSDTRAVLLGAASALLLIALPAEARLLSGSVNWDTTAVDLMARSLDVAGLALLAFSLITRSVLSRSTRLAARPPSPSESAEARDRPVAHGLSSLDRRLLFWMGLTAIALSTIVTLNTTSILGAHSGIIRSAPEDIYHHLLPGYTIAGIAANAALVVLLFVWLTRSTTAGCRAERLTAVFVLPLAGGSLAHCAVQSAFPRTFGLDFTPIVIAVVAAGLTLYYSIPRVETTRPSIPALKYCRRAADGGIGALVLITLCSTSLLIRPSVWLPVLMVSIILLLSSVCSAGTLTAPSPRRHLIWAAIGCGVVGVSIALTDASPAPVWWVALPAAVALLGLSAANRSAVRPMLALAGLLTALVPLAGTTSAHTPALTVCVAVCSAILLVVGSTRSPGFRTRNRACLDVAIISGALGALMLVARHTLSTLSQSTLSQSTLSQSTAADLTGDSWLAGLAVVAILIFLSQSSLLRTGLIVDSLRRRVMVRTLTILTLGLITVGMMTRFEPSEFDSAQTELTRSHSLTLGLARASILIVFLAALHFACWRRDRSPTLTILSWVSLGCAGVALIGALSTGAITTVEIGSVPIGIAVGITGCLTLARTPRARSMPWLIAGTSVLLVVSLLATAFDASLWRLVGLGLAAAAILVVGVIRRLKVPVLISAAVLIVHGFATFSPQIRLVYEAVPLWLWFIPVGVIIVVFAARFESSRTRIVHIALQIRNLR